VRARAPGKVVISGAYAVLDGAPAIVSAVSRYAVADSARSAERETPEVRAALGDRPAPWFDAGELFARGEKLGLGASAAILVAALAALELEASGPLGRRHAVRLVLPRALEAARAQGEAAA
jgi:phosphomevalonate kinase